MRFLGIVILDLFIFLGADHPPVEAKAIAIEMNLAKIGISPAKVRIDRGDKVSRWGQV